MSSLNPQPCGQADINKIELGSFYYLFVEIVEVRVQRKDDVARRHVSTEVQVAAAVLCEMVQSEARDERLNSRGGLGRGNPITT